MGLLLFASANSAIGIYSGANLATLVEPSFDVLSTTAKCGMKIPREAAIGTVAGSGWEAVVGAVKQWPNDLKNLRY